MSGDGIIPPPGPEQESSDRLGITVEKLIEDRRIVERLKAAYRPYAHAAGSMWQEIHDKSRALHELMREGTLEQLADYLRHPKDHYLLYGYESLTREWTERMQSEDSMRRRFPSRMKDILVRLAEALGALRVENPEHGRWQENTRLPADEVVAAIERVLGVSLEVPWPYEGYFGVATKSGVIGDRMLNGAYAAHRARELGAQRVLEIGAGLGHAARYGHLMGLQWTIADLPITNVAQGHFLMRTLGEDAVALEGERHRPGQIRVLTPSYLEVAERYDLVLNVDGLTEYGESTAEQYLDQALRISDRLLSINHEANAYSVNALAGKKRLRVARFPYWMRRGYVEELITR
jgi:hypothetical protein